MSIKSSYQWLLGEKMVAIMIQQSSGDQRQVMSGMLESQPTLLSTVCSSSTAAVEGQKQGIIQFCL